MGRSPMDHAAGCSIPGVGEIQGGKDDWPHTEQGKETKAHSAILSRGDLA